VVVLSPDIQKSRNFTKHRADEITDVEVEDERLYRAYVAKACDADEDAGTTLDDPITMSETINNGPVPYYSECAAAPSAGVAEAPVQSGQSSVQIQVNVTDDMH